MLRTSLCLAGLISLTTGAAAEVRAVHTIEPRAFGYFLGDTFERTIEIDSGPEDEIVAASLPRTGPSTYWLELREIDVDTERRGDGRRHTVKITYQTFYAPIDPRKITVPAIEIAVRGPSGSETAAIPAFTMVTSPLREIFPEKSDVPTDNEVLLADARPENRRSGWTRTGVLLTGALSLTLLLLLARDLAWWPFSARPARPFSRAAREISRALSKDGAGYRAALVALHRAFDQAAGQRLLAADVPGFIERHPEHRDIGSDVARFFEASRSVFFGDAQRDGEIRLPPSDLRQLAASLASQERSAR